MAKTHSPRFLSIVNAAREEIQECTAEDLMSLINDGAAVIDVRERHEFENGHFAGSIHIGKGVLERDIEKQNFSINTNLGAPDKLYQMAKEKIKRISGEGLVREFVLFTSCDGKGKQIMIKRMGHMIQQIVTNCSNCMGKGTFIEKENYCNECSANGFIIKDKNIQFPLNNGVLFGQDAVIENKGNQYKNVKR